MNNQIPKRNKISILRKWSSVVVMCVLNLPFSAGYKCKCVGGYSGSRCESKLYLPEIQNILSHFKTETQVYEFSAYTVYTYPFRTHFPL
jgi:hypothetical protein